MLCKQMDELRMRGEMLHVVYTRQRRSIVVRGAPESRQKSSVRDGLCGMSVNTWESLGNTYTVACFPQLNTK